MPRRGPVTPFLFRRQHVDYSPITGCRQKHGTRLLHLCPLLHGIGVGCEVVGVRLEGQSGRCCPCVRQQHVAAHTVNRRLTAQLGGVLPFVEQVGPLLGTQRTPQVGFVAAIHERVLAPINKGNVEVRIILVFSRIVSRSPTEQIQPAGINLALDQVVVRFGRAGIYIACFLIAYNVILIVGKTPNLRGRLVLRIALSELHFLAGIHREQSRQHTYNGYRSSRYIACRRLSRWHRLRYRLDLGLRLRLCLRLCLRFLYIHHQTYGHCQIAFLVVTRTYLILGKIEVACIAALQVVEQRRRPVEPEPVSQRYFFSATIARSR